MIYTYSKFFYGFEIDTDSSLLAFDEGDGELVADIAVARYAPTLGMAAVQSALNNAGTQGYTVSLDRVTRLVTISAPDPFDLLVQTGSVTSQAFLKLGFTGADRTGSNTYTGNLPVAREYEPQFKLQDYIASAENLRSIDPTVKKTADGTIEVVRFGTERLIDMNIRYATNKTMDGRVIKNNPTGVQDLIDFMEWCITKSAVEFMPDEDSPNTFQVLILESTVADRNGMSYSLEEQYRRNLPDFYDTGRLKFRLVV